MKVLVFALALAAAPAVASAQVAAGAIPNTFDGARPAAAAQPTAPRATPTAPAGPTEPANAKAEETLRAFISGAQAERIDYSVMTDDLAAKYRNQSASVFKVMKEFGALQAVDWMGQMEGADLFVVAFDNAPTEWLIGFTQEGKVAALLFRPQETAATAQPPAAPASAATPAKPAS